MRPVLFFDFLNDVVWVLSLAEKVIGARFNFGWVGDLSVQEEFGMVTDLREFVRVEPGQEGLCLVFGKMFVALSESTCVIFNVSRHFKVKRGNVNFAQNAREHGDSEAL